METCISYAYLSSTEMLTLLIKSLIDPNLNPFSQAWNKETLFFPIPFRMTGNFLSLLSMCNLAISPQAFNSIQKNSFNSVKIMPDNVSFQTG